MECVGSVLYAFPSAKSIRCSWHGFRPAAQNRNRQKHYKGKYDNDLITIIAELRVLVGCGWHTLRRACPQGIVMGAHSAGRVMQTMRPKPAREDPGTSHDFLSGDAGDVTLPGAASSEHSESWLTTPSTGSN